MPGRDDKTEFGTYLFVDHDLLENYYAQLSGPAPVRHQRRRRVGLSLTGPRAELSNDSRWLVVRSMQHSVPEYQMS